MGIYNFHTWLRQKYPEAYISIINNNIYEYIYIDVNFLLHNSIYDCKSDNDFIRKLYNQLDVIFSNFIATKKIFFNMDGPSPFAKIMLQRKRRQNVAKKINNNVINSLFITPGTESMKKIENYLKIYINKTKKKYRYVTPEFYFSSSDEPGEGEIKICKQVISNGKLNLNHRNLIIGNDSDLIVLSMGMKPIYNINILVRNKNANELISLSKLLECHSKYIKRDNDILTLAYDNLRDDFVIVSIMMGNDYLPKLGFINHENLWESYYKLIKIIDDNDTIIKNGVFDVNISKKFMYLIYKSLTNSFKKININTYDYNRTQSYLEGILWCLNMYQNGECPKYDYIYTGKNSVHPYEILFHLCSDNNINIPISHIKPIDSQIYPLFVLPKKAIKLIPEKYRKLMDNQLKYLYEAEECILCSELKQNINSVNNKLEKLIKESDEYKDLKKKNNIEILKYKEHKKIHQEIINIDDINKIIKITDKL